MGGMHGTCGTLGALLVLVTGAALLLFGLGNLGGPTAHVVGGGALVLLGLGKLMHHGDMCPMCKGKK
jgi:hypothetical protein